MSTAQTGLELPGSLSSAVYWGCTDPRPQTHFLPLLVWPGRGPAAAAAGARLVGGLPLSQPHRWDGGRSPAGELHVCPLTGVQVCGCAVCACLLTRVEASLVCEEMRRECWLEAVSEREHLNKPERGENMLQGPARLHVVWPHDLPAQSPGPCPSPASSVAATLAPAAPQTCSTLEASPRLFPLPEMPFLQTPACLTSFKSLPHLTFSGKPASRPV